MTEVRTSSLCERPCAGIEDTLEASIGTGGPQSVFDAAMAPTQESGLRENRTSRLSERAEAGRTLHLSRLYGQSGVMVVFQPPDLKFVPLAETINKVRTVPANSEFVQIARALGISLGD